MYKITNNDKSTCLWDCQAETLIAILAVRLKKIRDVEALQVINELNFMWLRKRDCSDKTKYTATKLQRDIVNEVGY